MSDKAHQQRQAAANRFKQLANPNHQAEEDDVDSGDEEVYYVDTKEQAPPPPLHPPSPKKRAPPKKKVKEETKEEKKDALPDLKLDGDLKEQIKTLMAHVNGLQEDKKKRMTEKEGKKLQKENKEKMFRQLSEDLLERNQRKQYYGSLLTEKSKSLYDAVKF